MSNFGYYAKPENWLFPASTEVSGFDKLYNGVTMSNPSSNNALMSKIRAKIIEEEGYKLEVYLDSVGKPTAGIGHLLTPSENLAYKVGDKVTKEQVEKWYEADIKKAIIAARDQAKELNKQNDTDFIIALVSVNFQLGTNWPAKFHGTYPILKKGDWRRAIQRFSTSLWARQTPKRVVNFTNAIEKSYNKGVA